MLFCNIYYRRTNIMNRKKFISIALCAAVCAGSTFALTSCSQDSNNTSSSPSSAVSSAAPSSSNENSKSSDEKGNEDTSSEESTKNTENTESTEITESKENADDDKTESTSSSSDESSSNVSDSSTAITSNVSQISENSEVSQNSQSSQTSQVSQTSENGSVSSIQTESDLSKFTETATPSQSKPTNFKESKTYNGFFKYFEGGNGHFKVNMSGDLGGLSTSIDMEYQKQGENVYSEYTLMGMTSSSIIKDGKSYSYAPVVYGENTYLVGDTTENDVTHLFEINASLDSYNVLESGTTTTTDGKTLNYEKVSIDDGSDNNIYIAYFDGDKFVQIDGYADSSSSSASSSSSSSSSSSQLKKQISLSGDFSLPIDEKLFEINPDYKQITAEDYYDTSGIFDTDTSTDPLTPDE